MSVLIDVFIAAVGFSISMIICAYGLQIPKRKIYVHDQQSPRYHPPRYP